MQDALSPSLEAALGQLLSRLPVKDYNEGSLVQLFQAHQVLESAQRGQLLAPVLRQRAEIAWQTHLADWQPSQVASSLTKLLLPCSHMHACRTRRTRCWRVHRGASCWRLCCVRGRRSRGRRTWLTGSPPR